MRNALHLAAVALCAIAMFSTNLCAEPPKVDGLVPSGAVRGASVEVEVLGKLPDDALIWCSRDDVSVSRPEDEKAKNKLTFKIAAEATPGLCWLRFYNDEGATSLRSFLIGTNTELSEKEPNNEVPQAHTLQSLPIVVNGRFKDRGDVDVFAVECTKGETLVASLCSNHLLNYPSDAVLQLLSPAGSILEQNDDTRAFDPQIAFPVPADGVYFLRMFAFPAAPNSSVAFSGGENFIYRLTVTNGPFVDHTLPLSISANEKTQLEIVGWNIPEQLRILSVDAAGAKQSVQLHEESMTNSLEIDVAEHPQLPEQEPNSLAKPQAVQLPAVITGVIGEPGDVDTYRFSAAKGDSLLFNVESNVLGQQTDTTLRLTDSTGKVLREAETRSDVNLDEKLAYKFPADGEYDISVTDLYDHGGVNYAYRLTVAPQVADIALDLAADMFLLKGDKPLEIPITVARNYGFTGEIEISAVGLPQGIKAEPVKSEVKGATAKKVTLKLTGKAAKTFHGTFQIVGKSLGEVKLSRPAQFPLPGTNKKSASLWLSAPGAKVRAAAPPPEPKTKTE